MEYRDWTKKDGSGRDISTSLLGYGCMRFPTLPDGRIDEVRAEKLLNTAREAGVNYFDTAFPYHGGESEPFVARGMTPRLKSWQLSEVVARLFAQAGLPDKAKQPGAKPPAMVPPADRAAKQ